MNPRNCHDTVCTNFTECGSESLFAPIFKLSVSGCCNTGKPCYNYSKYASIAQKFVANCYLFSCSQGYESLRLDHVKTSTVDITWRRKLWDTPVNNRGVPPFLCYSCFEWQSTRLTSAPEMREPLFPNSNGLEQFDTNNRHLLHVFRNWCK